MATVVDRTRDHLSQAATAAGRLIAVVDEKRVRHNDFGDSPSLPIAVAMVAAMDVALRYPEWARQLCHLLLFPPEEVLAAEAWHVVSRVPLIAVTDPPGGDG